MKNRFLANDLVIMEDICNGNCKYCITSGSKFKNKYNISIVEDRLKFNLDKLLDDENSYSSGKELKKNLDMVAEILKRDRDPAILKISGGEIFLIKGIVDFVKQQSRNHIRIQILTNGLLLNENLIEELSNIDNLSLQISMDGHTAEMNRHRGVDEKVQNKLCSILKLCESANIPVEINCVLTNANTSNIVEFAEYLNQYSNVLLLPYPVRGVNRDAFFPLKEQFHGISDLMNRYKEFEKVLPPLAYLESLYDFFKNGKRSEKCHIYRLIFHSFDDGILTPCPNFWFKSLGNLLEEPSNTLDKIGKDILYSVLGKKQKLIQQCVTCFTPWEILNLYVNGKIKTSELKKIHLYNHPDIIKLLEGVRNEEKMHISP